jgi:exosortase E/protease (VPEID-CTERM system)
MWFASGGLAIGFAGLALVPPKQAVQLVRSTGHVWAYALVVGAVAWRLSRVFPLWNGSFWKPATDLTFSLVGALLHLFLPVVVADRANMTIGSPNFKVIILPWCAGFEGAALMLVFSIGWVWFVRRELRFPQALLLIPAGMVTIWISNALRITALILIGVAGAPAVALGGFHSQAGWIAFNAVALSFSVAAARLPWLANRPERHDGRVSAANPVAAYLMPFLMILGAAMISRAVSGPVEWLYPLRFVGAAAAIWVFRHKYAGLEWKFGWAAPFTGVIVFAIWIALDRISGAPGNNATGAALASVPGAARIAWLTVRTLGAVVTVPFAEELAFRGFLLRRLISSDFESVSCRQFSLLAFLVSSVAFGIMHGDRWFAGTLAGMFYAGVLLWRGRIGDAVIAHATTNALLAAWVLFSGNWELW